MTGHCVCGEDGTNGTVTIVLTLSVPVLFWSSIFALIAPMNSACIGVCSSSLGRLVLVTETYLITVPKMSETCVKCDSAWMLYLYMTIPCIMGWGL